MSIGHGAICHRDQSLPRVNSVDLISPQLDSNVRRHRVTMPKESLNCESIQLAGTFGWRVASRVVRDERNGNARITADEVREMRRRNSDGERQAALAKDYPITQVTVSNIVLRKTWKHIE